MQTTAVVYAALGLLLVLVMRSLILFLNKTRSQIESSRRLRESGFSKSLGGESSKSHFKWDDRDHARRESSNLPPRRTIVSHKNYPVCNQVYTAQQILTELHLRDSPHFGFWRHSPFQMLNDGKEVERLELMITLGFDLDVDCVLQDSHVTDEQLLSVPGFADSRWRYIRTTSEWIPVFRLADHKRDDVVQWFDLEHYIGDYGQLENAWSVTPKGFPREQHYADPNNRWQVVLPGHRSFPDEHRKLHHLTPFKVQGLEWPEFSDCPRVVKPVQGTNSAGLFPHQQDLQDRLASGPRTRTITVEGDQHG